MKRTFFIFVVGAMLVSLTALYWITQPIFVGLDLAPALPLATVNSLPNELQAHVKKLSVELMPRDHRSLKNLDAAADYIRAEFTKTNANVSIQPYKVDGFIYQNVIASFGPAEGEAIVVGAHYDAFSTLPAADDNASGIAGLIELAKLLGSASSEALKHRIELVAYTLEEPPHFRSERMGSYIHAQRSKNASAKVRLMISLECIGYFSDAANTQDFPLPGLNFLYPSTGNFIAIVGRIDDRASARKVKRAMRSASPLPVRSINAPEFVQGIDFSDQLNYWARGIPAVMVTDTAFLRNKAYHTAGDTFDRLDYQRMGQVVTGVYAAVIAMDQAKD